MSRRPLSRDYQNLIQNKDRIRLVVMGKDPFPTNPTGIPFCKSNWDEQLRSSCCGRYVLQSLGVNLDIIRDNYNTPIQLFFNLLEVQGLVFLNLSYDFMNGLSIRKKNHKHELMFANGINQPILLRAENIVLCGEAEKNRWYSDKNLNPLNVIHPDIQNRNHPDRREQWNLYWQPNSLADRFFPKENKS